MAQVWTKDLGHSKGGFLMKKKIKAGILELIKKWKDLLGLENWTVELVELDPFGGSTPDPLAVGLVEVYEDKEFARVHVVDPFLRNHDVEDTVVHELLHVIVDLILLKGKKHAEWGVEKLLTVIRNLKGLKERRF
jgi:hypothetical protein